MKLNNWKFTAFALALLIGSHSLMAQENLNEQEKGKLEGIRKLDAMMSIVNYAYVDPVDNGKIVEDAIVGMLKELDPHSVYIPKKDLQRMNEPLEGNFEGIGIQFNIFKDTIIVVAPITGGPSEKLGIRSGDKIVKVEGEVVAGIGITNADVQKYLRGKKGTVVNVDILRKGEEELLPFDIVRDKIPIFSVDASYMATPEIGYIKVNRFARKTMEEFRTSIDALKEEGAKSLILDLRGNGGGYLQTAYTMADEFLGQGKMIVYTSGDKQKREEYKATSRGGFESGKLVVLIDEGSASASEIVSGAVQDWDRGLIIGRRSFGKGLVQKPYPLPDGSAVRLTTARYYTPTGRSIQRPYDEGKEDYYSDINRRYTSGELMSRDSIQFPDSLKFFTPKKRIVFGGGGIMPDIFVPLDTSLTSDYYQKLIRKGLFNEFVLTYLDDERQSLKKNYPDFETFNKGYDDNKLTQKFLAFADKKGIEKVDAEYATSERLIKVQLKALVARNLFSTSEYFEVVNQLNDSYLEAINALQGDEFLKAKLEYE